MIVVERLAKRFQDLKRGEVIALDGVSFTCQPGQIFGLLGLNGAGKSTAMRILSTVLRPSSGRATVAGYDVVHQAAKVRKQIGFLSTGTALYDRMAAWEHVEYFGRLYGMNERDLQQRIERIFHSLAMEDIRDVLVSKMSTGQRQKVSIARAIVHDPPVLIFDEPTNGLDILVSRALLQNILELRAQGKCILYSTHHMREVEKLCDQVAIIHRGRILEQGTLTELRDRFGEQDIEEIFFRIIEADARERSPALAAPPV